jgi:hypothetical protein
LTVGDGVQAGGAYYRNMASATTPGPPVGANADVLIRRAQEAERSTDPGADSLYLKACHEAIVSGRIDVLTAAVLQLIKHHRFGTAAGQLPALLHAAYLSATERAERGRLAAAMARLWVYTAVRPPGPLTSRQMRCTFLLKLTPRY